MPGELITLGPFSGGFTNRVSDPSALDDKDLVECTNFIFDIYGNLITRPSIVEDTTFTTISKVEVLLWTLIDDNEVIIIADDSGTYAQTGNNGVWVKISGNRHNVCVQGSYQSDTVIWFGAAKGATGSGGRWSVGSNSIVAYSNIIYCTSMVWHKERVFYIGTDSKLYWTNITPNDNADWVSTGTNSVDVSPNDGQRNRALRVFQDSIYIFKNQSTYLFTYDANILNFQLRLISNVVGTPNNDTVVIYSDTMFSFHDRFIYRFTGSTFAPLSQKILLFGSEGITTSEPSLSIWADTLALRYGSVCFVYNFYTESWTTWTSDLMFTKIVEKPRPLDYKTLEYLGGGVLTNKLVRMKSSWDVNDKEDMTCRVQTKVYDMDSPGIFKRIFWWGVNAVVSTGKNTGIKLGFAAYNEVGAIRPTVWEEYLVPDAEDSDLNKLMKVRRSFRFRMASFFVEFTTDGSQSSSLNTIVLAIKSAAVVPGKTTSQIAPVSVASPASLRGF
jgi:hypothetical protein